MVILLPAPTLPTMTLPGFFQMDQVLVTRTAVFDDVIALLPRLPDPLITVAPLLIVRLLLAPLVPTSRLPVLVQRELVPVTNAELFEEVLLYPRLAAPLKTVAPLLIVRLLLAPLVPTLRVPVLVQSEPTPVTRAELLREVVFCPIFALVSKTVAPALIVRLLPEPAAPTVRVLVVFQREPVPVTKTELFEELVRPLPILP